MVQNLCLFLNSLELTSAPQSSNAAKEKECGVSNQHSLPSSSWDVHVSGLLIRKGRKAREEEAEPKMLIDFPRSSQQSTIDSVTSNNRNSTASLFCRLEV